MITTNNPANATAAIVAIAYSAVAAPSSLVNLFLIVLKVMTFLFELFV